MSEIITTKELAKYLKIHELTVRKFAKQGRIPGAVRIGRVWRFNKELISKCFSQPAKVSPDDQVAIAAFSATKRANQGGQP